MGSARNLVSKTLSKLERAITNLFGPLFRVIPNLFRDLGFLKSVVAVSRKGVGKSKVKPVRR
jgi:hypothetical protein